VSVYGTNLKFMPELEWKYGYPVSLFVVAGTAAPMIFYCKRKKYL